jgi:L-gulonolactone oxidase
MRVLRRPRWRNWGRTFVTRPDQLLFPRSAEEVMAIVRAARAAGRHVRPVGAGYSYAALVQTDDDLLSLDELVGLERIDLAARLAVFRAGTRLHRVVAELAEHGAALANLGDIDRQTLAGAIATGTHGTGIEIGSTSSQVVGLTLVDGTGEMRELDARRTPTLFPSAQIGLGALGVVTSVTLAVEPMYHLHVERGAEPLDSVLRDLSRLVRSHRNFEFFWFPQDVLAYTKRMRCAYPGTVGPSGAVESPSAVTGPMTGPVTRAMRWVNDVVVENGAVWAACEMVRRWPALRPGWLRLGHVLAPRSSAVLRADQSYATPRLVRHFETEYAVPMARAQEALAALVERLRTFPVTTMFPLEVRFTKGEAIPLSATAGRETMWVAVHTYAREPYRDYFDACETLLLAHDGRPHWGKLHRLRAPELRGLYPRWDEFQAARRQLDPDGVFGSDYLSELLGQAALDRSSVVHPLGDAL